MRTIFHRLRFIFVVLTLAASIGLVSSETLELRPGDVMPALDFARYPTVAALAEARIPAANREEIARRFFGLAESSTGPASQPLRQVGERQSFNVVNTAENLIRQVDAELLAVGQHIYIWAEAGQGVSRSAAEGLALRFDRDVYHQTRALWGSEALPGIDGDTRIYALFATGINPATMAYFTSQHNYPASIVSNSNEHEMIFFNLSATGLDIDRDEVASTAAHEFQHMIRHNITVNESTWLDEGFSMFTERQIGFDSNMWAALAFISSPGTQLNNWSSGSGRAAQYGASMLFVGYFFDRYGLEGLQLLSAHQGVGLQAVDGVLAQMGQPSVDMLFADWALANLLQDPAQGYGYAAPALRDMPPAAPMLESSQYPFMFERRGQQYSTDYYRLSGLNGQQQMEIRLQAPPLVPLLPLIPASGEWFLYSNKADDSNTRLTQRFDLTGVDRATLRYKAWYDIETDWDFVYVSASTDDGQTWHFLQTPHMSQDNSTGRAYGPGYTGSIGYWLEEEIPLDAFAGQSLLLRFEMITDDAVTQPGFALEDVQIEEIGYFSDFEQDAGGWEMDGWLRTDNRLPQRAWVQAVQHLSDGGIEVTRWLSQADASAAEQAWQIALLPNVEAVSVALSPFAPLTTVPMRYTLHADLR